MNKHPNQVTITEKPSGFAVYGYSILFGMLRLIGYLPISLINALGALLGKLLHTVKSRRKIVLANLNYCFPELTEQERRDLCKEHFKYLGIGFVELGAAWYKPFRQLDPYCEVRGLDIYEKAKADNRGVLLLGYHSTSMELAGILLSRHVDFVGFYRPNKNKAIDYHIQKGRNNRLPMLGRNDIRMIGKLLKGGDDLLFMPDQDMGTKNTVFAHFYNQPMATLNSPVRIAKMGNATVLPVSYHKKNEKMIIEIMPEITFTGEMINDCQAMNDALQTAIDKAPAQYYWVHRRFKTLPEDKPSIY